MTTRDDKPGTPKKVFVTGTAGFIGYHLADLLLREGYVVHGYDGMTDYYDVGLKRDRHRMLHQNANFSATEAMLEDHSYLASVMESIKPDIVVHLAAQAGVRYSLENPRAYIESNIVGTFNVMDAARELKVEHLLMASTSSVYGANEQLPFSEDDKADTPLTIYAATKKATESMGHAYAHMWHLPITMFRFFTVYGPWGRPDMALFKFVDAIIEDKPLDIYNHGEMYRDFTYVTDLVHAIRLLMNQPPERQSEGGGAVAAEGTSSAGPFRVVNIGNSQKVRLLDFVDAIEAEVGKKASRNYMPMQRGDLPATWADAGLLQRLTGYRPQTDVRDGIREFVRWFREYYRK